jgi:asparagine synthase (glutamine-hydrolysing)
MAQAVEHRGPDSVGFHQRGDIGLAIRRLRIIDLATGDQPIRSECYGATIVYNGELYNYRELRDELEARGHRFITRSDTEVVLHFYEQYGPDAFGRLNGIFAFAIDDPVTDTLVLARDHLGVKPLYVAHLAAKTIAFASEPKALFASGLVPNKLDERSIGTYLTYGHAVGDRTIWSKIKKLAPGHALLISNDGSQLVRYWDVVSRSRHWAQGSLAPTDELSALLEDAVRRNMISDVPVGAFLSGGIDSSLVTALMRRDTRQLRTYSVGFGHAADELDDARRVSQLLGTQHTALMVTASDAQAALDDVVRIYDEPFADAAGLPTFLLAKRARENVTVVLTGEGGDELFGGYRRYVGEQAHNLYRHLPMSLRSFAARDRAEAIAALRRPARILRALANDDRAARYSVWTETFSAFQVERLLGRPFRDPYRDYEGAAASVAGIRDDVTAMMAVEIQTWLADAYLEKVDKATMAASLEARVPLLDPRLVEMMALAPRRWKIRGRATKVLLREVAARFLPERTIRKPKQGFGPPVGLWLRTTLRDRVRELGQRNSAIGDHLEPGEIKLVIDRFDRGGNAASQLWALLVFDIWARQRRTQLASALRS